MNTTDLFAVIESAEFDAEVNLASTPTVFWSILSRSQPIQAALEILREDPTTAKQMIRRVVDLVSAEFDPQYANPHDTALAAYIWALSQVEPSFALIGASIAVGAQQTWWLPEFIDAVFNGLPEPASNALVGDETVEVSIARTKKAFKIKNAFSTGLTTAASLVQGLTVIPQMITDSLRVLAETSAVSDVAVGAYIESAIAVEEAQLQVSQRLPTSPSPIIVPALRSV